MRRRRTAEEVARLLREADRDLAKGLTVSDICRKQGIAETTYYRWRQQYAPEGCDRRLMYYLWGPGGRIPAILFNHRGPNDDRTDYQPH